MIERPNVAVGLSAVEICDIPPKACEGQMSFLNNGATTIALRLGQGKGSRDVSLTSFTILLVAGASFTEEGLVAGSVIAISSVAGGLLSTYISYRQQ